MKEGDESPVLQSLHLQPHSGFSPADKSRLLRQHRLALSLFEQLAAA